MGKSREMNSERFNELVDKIRMNNGWFEPVMKLCKDYYQDHPSGGSLHIVLDDGNLKKSSIQFCEGYACGREDKQGSQIASLMLWMTYKQRQRVYRGLH